jgi:citrate lyase subunit beta/citryl-CoA lyase
MSPKPRRSVLYLPASNAKAIAKSRTLDCDVVILDLEDAVAPDAKLMARDQAIAAATEGGFGERELVIRVNGPDTEWGKTDFEQVAAASPDAILVPKVSAASDIETYASLLGDRPIPLWAMVETAISLFRLEEIAAMARQTSLSAFVVGTNDLAKEIGAQLDVLRAPFVGALGLAVAAARAHGLAIIDGVYNDLADDEGFLVQARQAVAFGFDGKTLIHPRQIDLCHEAFTPDDAAVDWARQIINAFNQPDNQAKGAIQIDGKMVERLHLVQAQRTIALAGGARS